VQRSVENLVARAMLSGHAQPGSSLTITRSDIDQLLSSTEQATSIANPPAPS